MKIHEDAITAPLNDVTVGIKTFYRPDKISISLNSLVDMGFCEVIVVDDGEIDSKKENIYAKYSKKLPLKIIELPYDSGLSEGRNRIAECCSTNYLLLIDDDIAITKEVSSLKTILEADFRLGG